MHDSTNTISANVENTTSLAPVSMLVCGKSLRELYIIHLCAEVITKANVLTILTIGIKTHVNLKHIKQV